MPLDRATQAQQQASSPDTSVWVTASAGSGKTKVLTDRLLNLMLSGADPTRILCLTFTKAAAAEMENRLYDRLGTWVILEEDALSRDLQTLLNRPASPEDLQMARQLFSLALDTPGGLKIQTIHAFCQSTLKRFPLEAGLSPHFNVIDDKQAAEILHQAQGELLQSPNLQGTLQHLGQLLSPQKFLQLNQAIIHQRQKFAATPPPQPVVADPSDLIESFLANTNQEEMWKAAEILRMGSKTDTQRGEAIIDWLESAGEEYHFETYVSCFLTAKGEVRQKLLTQDLNKKHPDLLPVLENESLRVQAAVDDLKSLSVALNSYHITHYAQAMLTLYEEKKTQVAALDYQDLILKTAALLNDSSSATWVLYKLDGGIDHILIDEAQDTSPEQWQVITALSEEFFTHGDDQRTLFVVGDEKQSIYSFQGADPKSFSAMQVQFKEASIRVGKSWTPITMDVSFRSTPQVLQAVDAVFEGRTQHLPFRAQEPGHVEIWPLISAEEDDDIDPWSLPQVNTRHEPPRTRLAQLLAKTIHQWLQEKKVIKGRLLRPGDILILVRKRSAFVDEVIRNLKDYNVPVAGIDRMILLEQLAVQDLMKLAEFTLLPENDLTLATVLKGPLFGLSEEDLFELAYGRGKESLWAQLQEGSQHRSIFETLSSLIHQALTWRPYEFFTHILGPLQGRKLWQSRLGPECLDPLDEFLNLALSFEKDHVPSLQTFLHWIQQDETELKRDLDQSDEVRIMTVHGSKGLQAPVIFLPDTVQLPSDVPPFLWEGSHCTWMPASEGDTSLTRRLKQDHNQHQLEEYQRLLYVALTRAEDHLYVCGWQQSNREVDEDSWYARTQRGLATCGVETSFDFTTHLGEQGWEGSGWVLSKEHSQTMELPENQPEPQKIATPEWLSRPLTPDPQPTHPLTPSKLGGEESLPSLAPDLKGLGLKRGQVVHKLLEILPQLPPGQWEEGSQHYLEYQDLPETEKERITHSTLSILKDYPFLFSETSQAEVPVVGLLGSFSLSGQIDRLVVTDKEVHIVDYKTNASPPATLEQTPETYLRQLAAYKAALAAIYPDHEIHCSLLWTTVPRLDTLPSILIEKPELFAGPEELAA